MEKTWEVVNCFLCVLSEWKQSLWKLRSLGKEVYGKSKGHVRKIGDMLASVKLGARVSGSRKSPDTGQ